MQQSNRDRSRSRQTPRFGLYRTKQSDLGDCARIHPDAGDAAPYLPRTIYKSLKFKPCYEELPSEEEYSRAHPASSGWSV